MAREGGARFGLWDRLVLLVAWLVTCGLVYLLGVYVGTSTQDRRVGVEDRVVRLPITSSPPPQGARPKGESDLTFYESLGAGERSAVPRGQRAVPPPPRGVNDEPAAPPPRAPSAPPPPAPAGPTTAAPPPVAPAVAAVPPATLPPPAVARASAPDSAAPRAPVPPPAAAPVPASLPATPPVARASAPASPGARPLPPPASAPRTVVPPPTAPLPRTAGGGWTVLAGPTRDRAEAESLQRTLRTRGYDTKLVRVARDGETWYRVQVGRFPSAAQANETMQRLRGEGVAHAFVAAE